MVTEDRLNLRIVWQTIPPNLGLLRSQLPAVFAVQRKARIADIARVEEEHMRPRAPRVTVDENVRFGRPVIEGSRVPFGLAIGKVARGMSAEDIC
jgi:hypothetical protein